MLADSGAGLSHCQVERKVGGERGEIISDLYGWTEMRRAQKVRGR